MTLVEDILVVEMLDSLIFQFLETIDFRLLKLMGIINAIPRLKHHNSTLVYL